jgi:N-acetylmuramoyl-L-alanine amidase
MGSVYWFFSPQTSDVDAIITASLEGSLSAPIFKSIPAKSVTQRLAQSPGPLRIGIIAGHQGFDSGSVCADGLTEVEVNTNIAQRVVAELRAQGINTDLLDEFDSRLEGYSATAVISIHADSCTYINDLATGYKIAGSSVTESSRLSICVEQAYQESTLLPYHENTITPHMTDYHVFREISPGTPAIIIEVGFVYLDRELLTVEAEKPVAGLINGTLCYLNS